MRIMHVSAGLPPSRDGGLPAYVAELMAGQRSFGHEVFYVCTGNYRTIPGCRLEASRDGAEFQITNTGGFYFDHGKTLEPLRQVIAPEKLTRIFRSILGRVLPEIIHVHEMLGLPAQIIPFFRSLGFKVVFTAQDYFSLCPTIKLYTWDDRVCALDDEELVCNKCCENGPYLPGVRARSVYSKIRPLPVVGQTLFNISESAANFVSSRMQKRSASRESYIARRKGFRKCMASFDRILCMSHAQFQEMARVLGTEIGTLQQQYLSRRTYGTGPVRVGKKLDGVTRFVALNVNSVAKGKKVLLSACDLLSDLAGQCEIHIYGSTDTDTGIVKWKGPYDASSLDEIARSADCGIIPSVWRESFGYVGVELLTRGVPLIVSDAGGMKEYVTHDHNGLVVKAGDAIKLASTVRGIVNNPSVLERLRLGTCDPQPAIVAFDDHLRDLESVYRDVLKG